MDHDRTITIFGEHRLPARPTGQPALRLFRRTKGDFFFVSINVVANSWGSFRRGAENSTRGACAPQNRAQEFSGMRAVYLRNLLRRSGGDHVAACITCFRAEIDNPIRALDHFEVMLDHNDRVSVIDKPLK